MTILIPMNSLKDGWKQLARENRELASQLQLFREALKHPAPDIGWVYQDTLSNMAAYPATNLTMMHQVGIAVANAVLADLHETNIDSALSGLQSLSALAKVYRNDLALICLLERAGNMRVVWMRLGRHFRFQTWMRRNSPGCRWIGSPRALLEGLERSIQVERARGADQF